MSAVGVGGGSDRSCIVSLVNFGNSGHCREIGGSGLGVQIGAVKFSSGHLLLLMSLGIHLLKKYKEIPKRAIRYIQRSCMIPTAYYITSIGHSGFKKHAYSEIMVPYVLLWVQKSGLPESRPKLETLFGHVRPCHHCPAHTTTKRKA